MRENQAVGSERIRAENAETDSVENAETDSAGNSEADGAMDTTEDSRADGAEVSDSASIETDSLQIERHVAQLSGAMSLEQKVAQMIMPAIRTWGSGRQDVTSLSRFPDLAGVLRRHQYGGVILFSSNIVDTEQTVRLIHDLQANNAQSPDAGTAGVIPYMIAADQEGGSVARLSMGIRGTGSMAIGATGDEAGQIA
ncbi:MAG: hypothetical protein IKR84_03350, partial [Oscillibacter sp.]|nr:hypothetical protein [Oscillibacter sp.]